MKVEVNVKDRILKPIDEIFQAIVKPDKLSCYFVSNASGPIEEGTSPIWSFDFVGVNLSPKILKVKLNELIFFEWDASGTLATVKITFEEIDTETTLIKINESEWPMDKKGVEAALRQTQGWTDFICSLKAFLYCGINLREGRINDIH
jgi:uncharacterized protein YndB with AHSA1/START domain